MPAALTRGQRHLQQYLESNAPTSAKAAAGPKTAHDVVPVLKERAQLLGSASVGSDHSRRSTSRGADSIHAAVVAHLQAHKDGGATNKLSPRQLKLVLALSSRSSISGPPGSADAGPRLCVRRAVTKDVAELVDTVAVAALQRASGVADADLTGASLFVLTETAATARALATDLQQRYGLSTLLLADGQERHPTFPLTPKSRGRSPLPPPTKRARKGKKDGIDPKAVEDSNEEKANLAGNHTEESLEVAVVVATPEGFLAVDKRSAIWKFIGSYVIALTQDPKRHAQSLQRRLAGTNAGQQPSETKSRPTSGDDSPSVKENSLAVRLSAHRWDCLGHTTVAVVLSHHEAALVAPELDWLLTLRPTAHRMTVANAASRRGDAESTAPITCALRKEVVVHYAVAEGLHRFGFLFSLVKSLGARSGLVVHFATKEACALMYNVLYGFLDELPKHVRLLTDYEGEGQFTASISSLADRYKLCQEFNEVVSAPPGGKGHPTAASGEQAAVLLTCYGLVPTKGTIFVSYDVIPDVVNFGSFVADVLTPGAYLDTTKSHDSEEGRKAAGAVPAQRDGRVLKRGRSVSPPPPPQKASKGKKGASHAVSSQATATNVDDGATPAVYTHIILLLRRNEVTGALRHLKRQERRHHLRYTPLPHGPSLSTYLLAGEALREMHRRVFAIANAAFSAYKATMTAYCTVGPRDVYDEREVDLQKVCEEFGITALPLLDLRLKDTAFRPRVDYYKAARKKQAGERRAYKRFADNHIAGEAPDEHAAAQ